MTTRNVKRYAIVGDVTPTTVGSVVSDDTVRAMRDAVKRAERAKRRASKQENIARYNAAMQRRQSRRGRRS